MSLIDPWRTGPRRGDTRLYRERTQARIIALLKAAPEPMSSRDIANALEEDAQFTQRVLRDMTEVEWQPGRLNKSRLWSLKR